MKFSHKKTYSGITKPFIISKNRIDKEKTYEIYFEINQLEKCLKLAIQSRIINKSLVKSEKIVKTYFIVEKGIDISRFTYEDLKNRAIPPKTRPEKNIQRSIYSEIGRNFDHIWNRKRELLICTSKGDPIKKLDKSIYRLRFTTFAKENFSFRITIYSNHEITFMEKPE